MPAQADMAAGARVEAEFCLWSSCLANPELLSWVLSVLAALHSDGLACYQVSISTVWSHKCQAKSPSTRRSHQCVGTWTRGQVSVVFNEFKSLHRLNLYSGLLHTGLDGQIKLWLTWSFCPFSWSHNLFGRFTWKHWTDDFLSNLLLKTSSVRFFFKWLSPLNKKKKSWLPVVLWGCGTVKGRRSLLLLCEVGTEPPSVGWTDEKYSILWHTESVRARNEILGVHIHQLRVVVSVAHSSRAEEFGKTLFFDV